jgi:hypothetical protein
MNRSRVQVPSSFPPAPQAISGGHVQRKRRARRSVEAILHDAQTPLEEAVYAVNRIGGLKMRMAHVLGSLSPEAQDLIRSQFPELNNLLPHQ